MSRTYRCRRLPKLPGSARKLLDGNVGGLVRRFSKQLEREIEEAYGPLDWNLRWNALRALERQFILPAANKGHHPWLWMEVYYAKKPFRVAGNRLIRRQWKNRAWEWAALGDDFTKPFRAKKDGWDWWDIL